MKIVIIGTLPSSLVNFRGHLISSLVEKGHSVTVMASGFSKQEVDYFNQLGVSCKDYRVSRSGINPIHDFLSFVDILRCYREVVPDFILSYTIKPVIWGGIASLFINKCSFFAMVTGLGYAFQTGNFKRRILNYIVSFLYRISLKNAKGVIFQNRDNMNVFIEKEIVKEDKCFLVNGSGVDLSFYKKTSLPLTPQFLLIARLLGDKGIREYAQAAEIVKTKYPTVTFNLVGPEDPSPDGIPQREVNVWHDEGTITYHGGTDDVRPFIKRANIFVLPSYHEGMPRTVLEAMAMGRPILTTDVPGCRETVVNGENGWLVEKANVEQLAKRMIWFIENQDQWSVMGEKSHIMVNEKFDVHKVNAEILKIMGLANEKTV